jgi:hypothetical protein
MLSIECASFPRRIREKTFGKNNNLLYENNGKRR